MSEIRANNVPEDLLLEIDQERARRKRMTTREATIDAFRLWLGKAVATADDIHVETYSLDLLEPKKDLLAGLSQEHRAMVTALVEMLTADPVPKGLDSVRAAVITLLGSWQLMTTPPRKGRKSQNE